MEQSERYADTEFGSTEIRKKNLRKNEWKILC